MKVKILYILLVITSILCSCHIREEMESATEGNGNIVLNFSVKGNMTTRAEIGEEFEFESRINHLDVLIYRITDGGGNSDTRIYHTRLTDVTEGTPKTLPGINLSTLTQTQESKIYKICIVANSAREESVFSGELTDTFTELTNLVETTQYINITGSTLFKDENGHNIAPQAFLMTGSGVHKDGEFVANGISTSYGPCIDLSSRTASELPLRVDLERAAAKIRMNFTIKENSQNVHTFANPIGADIYTKDNKEYVDITSLGTNVISYNYSEASYYLRNMTYTSALYGTNTGSKRKTNPVPYTDGGYMTHSDNHKTISVTAYVYSCSWDGTGDESFTNTPFMVVNLPLIEKMTGTISGATIKGGSNQKDLDNAGIYLSRNYYEIPLRIRNSGSIEIQRNHYYVINATIDAPGGMTDMEPFPIVPVNYYVYPWNEKSLDIGTSGSDAIKYLNLSTNHIEMHNSSANSTIKFSSSSNIAEIRFLEAYYVNKMGIRTDIPNTNNAINATATGMNGTITVNSPVPTNNAISYLTFQISNNDGVSKTFTVEQRPLLYITNTLGWYSYRDDITNTSGIVTHFENRQSNNKTSNDDFSFKVTKSAAADGSSNVYGYSASWSLGAIGTSQYQGWYTNWFSGLGRENARMYHIVVSSTSSTYKLGKPHVDTEGRTVNDASNAQLVSPSFIIASQLGTMNSQDDYSETNFSKAQTHCKNYVETYIVNDNGNNLYDANSNESVVHLRGWRLPTKAEIEIIKAHQTESVAMDDLLIGVNYFCITGTNDKYLKVFDDNWANRGYWTRCVRDTY